MLLALLAVGCGRAPVSSPLADTTTTRTSSGSGVAQDAAPQTDMQLAPLNGDDVAFYLRVMRAAAERVEHPTASDREAQSRARNVATQASAGKTAILTPADQAALMRALLLQGQADRLIVEERHLDIRRYEAIATAIEAMVPDPAGAFGSGDGPTAAEPHALTPLERKIKAVEAENAEFLKPFVPEIQKLLTVVRHPPPADGT
ncbi:MAG: hypothetical protein QJR02_06730 [Sinobacteraceae bacterium]|nr:hypothetical protein [Nevskiaceae bacterium]